jgi:hypothetical protein
MAGLSVLEASVGVQAVAFASTITVDPLAGAWVVVGTLTGPITIANPVSPELGSAAIPLGCQLTFDLTQDSGGSRAVSWGTLFLHALYTASTAATYRDLVTFAWDGSHWVLQHVVNHVA